jgi:hypothetical protein
VPVDPVAKTLEAMKLSNQGWISIGSFGGDEWIQLEPFDGLKLDLSLFWVPTRSV